MRTGTGARVLLLFVFAVCVLAGGVGFVGLIEHARASNPNDVAISVELSLAMALAGTLAAVVLLVGYCVLAELQAQTAGAFGAVRGPRHPLDARPREVLTPPDAPAPTPGLRIGRGDSWS